MSYRRGRKVAYLELPQLSVLQALKQIYSFIFGYYT
jgi:hypothetical protein